jgi:hypothetical protein
MLSPYSVPTNSPSKKYSTCSRVSHNAFILQPIFRGSLPSGVPNVNSGIDNKPRVGLVNTIAVVGTNSPRITNQSRSNLLGVLPFGTQSSLTESVRGSRRGLVVFPQSFHFFTAVVQFNTTMRGSE